MSKRPLPASRATKPLLLVSKKKGDTTHVKKDEARRNNIMVAKLISESLRTTLGPRGRDKLIIGVLKDELVTNDGATIMEKVNLKHPIAKLMTYVAKTQDLETGDGTTTAVILIGELLKQAESLLEQKIHPTKIADGYTLALAKALELLKTNSIKIDPDDDELLEKIAVTSINSKNVVIDLLARIAAKAVKGVMTHRNGKPYIDTEYIEIEKKSGKSLRESELIKGLIINRGAERDDMPKKMEHLRIAVINQEFDVPKSKTDAKIRINSPEQMATFLNQEYRLIKGMVDQLVEAGANVLLTQKEIDPVAADLMARAGMVGLKNLRRRYMPKIAKAVGATIVNTVNEITPEDLGAADLLEIKVIEDRYVTFITGCKDSKTMTILLRGSGKHMMEEAERSLRDAMYVVKDVIEDEFVAVGGGAIEESIASGLRDYARSIGGREQFAVEAFAKALEIVPKTLAENGGYDAISLLAQLRAKHHEENGKYYGMNPFTGKIENMYENGVLEPVRVKLQAISSATEAAVTVLRIDEILAARRFEDYAKDLAQTGELSEEHDTFESVPSL
ncbi:thermosome subunit beta [Candidatus Borrarchaeum sp.]|uniref:thermosome subunit beta n=1 Tax=Candidatus Borrarchaeum sp. TaxID=2846742 RepID=UPI00257C8FC7|nr:thermosome subunit beta [Candidatus Borrarchaeum sp.]